MAKWRLHFDGDNVWIEKEARIYSLTDDVERKINSIPNVIDNTSSTSATDALSANMGRDLQEQINNLASRGRYLSTWNAETWLPDTNPQVSPYVYRAWDYYIVSNVVSGTNYRPHGSSYVIWEASTDVEMESISVNDLYIYDWAQWIRQWSWSWASVTWWSIVGILSNQTDLQNALNAKANATDVNTKTFYLTWTTGETNMAVAREIHEWMSAWNMAIIHLSTGYLSWDVFTYTYYISSGNVYPGWVFKSVDITNYSWAGYYRITKKQLRIVVRNGVVEEIYLTTDPQVDVPPKTYVDNNDTYIWSSAPTDNVVEWRLWYDTTNDVLKVYDGTNWNTTWATYTAWDHIEISNANVISATWLQEELTAWDNITIEDVCHPDNQWPCPDGYHIPTMGEWNAFCDLGVQVGALSYSDWTLCTTYLKMPFAGWRDPSSSNAQLEYAPGMYWACTWVWTTDGEGLRIDDVGMGQNGGILWYGFSIRAFKDTPAVPDSSWTTLYDWSSIAAGAWIFHNSTLWLISVSADGQNWATIADKNLWATTVYNNWDTLSEANCGKFYQRWNNYWFPRTWSVTASSTKPDVSSYWPGNYYSSDTFITTNYDEGWPLTPNTNLWWWISQWTRCQNVISAEGTTYTAWNWINIDQNDEISVDTSVVATQTDLDTKQDVLTAWENIQIDTTTNTISATDTKYSAWRNITIGWNVINARDTEYEAWSNVTITCPTESDKKWPCPSGFHIWTKSELETIKQVWINLWAWALNNWAWVSIYLKMPQAWWRQPSWRVISGWGYWTTDLTGSYDARYFRFDDGQIYNNDNSQQNPSYCFSIRPIKNTPVAPDSSWTTLYDWSSVATWAWIFYNATDWLISFSDDWTTWYTIADKNVWATTVYNYWDTLSDANCWGLFQCWNNYMFPRTWNLPKNSSTPVDASWYWPWNYYYSDVHITASLRDTTRNWNLWWWQTQWTWQDCEHPIISAAGWATYTAWNWIDIDQNGEISIDTTVVATQTDIANFFDKTSDDADDIDDTNSTNKFVTATDKSTWDWKQDELIAWTNIQIAADGKTISATDTTYTAWDWIDITGTTISADTDVLQEKLTAWDNITIGSICHRDTQWPCPDGFHIPALSEWNSFVSAMNTLWASYIDAKIPLTWKRYTDTTWINAWEGFFHIATPLHTDYATNDAFYRVQVDNWDSYKIKVALASYPDWLPIRPFKDTPVVPDSSWTTLYDWSSVATWAWIFHNTTLWLISISANWTDWITIAEKNLWATQVWNNWDAVTSANSWKSFQWWNNYAFPWISNEEPITTSSSQWPTWEWYWPWNYYSTSTFYLDSSNTRVASNLWWWITDWTWGCSPLISATNTDTTYSAWTWLTLNWTTFSADTTVLATKQDIADLWTFEVVASLPSVGTADTKTIYLLWPIWTGADKYEEWIVTEDAQQQKQRTKIWETSIDLSDLNTKTFYLANTSDLTTAQAAYDWYLSGKNPIIVFEDRVYILSWLALYSPNYALHFIGGTSISTTDAGNNKTTPYHLGGRMLNIEYNSSDEVVTIHTYSAGNDFLPSNSTAEVVYTPTENWDPATKKYVDDTVAWAWYSAWTWINIDANNEISNTLPWPTIAATAPTWTEWALWYDTTNDVLMAHDWTAWKEAWTQMKILSYGNSTWQDFIDAYNENAIVYCRASSNTNPATWNQTRMAFMAYVNSATPTEVEFQYYRSRSDHNTAANQLDQVFVYKLTSASWWTWTVTERNTWAKAVAWTWINLAFGSGNMTISADTTTLATKSDLNNINEVPSWWTEWQVLTKWASGYGWEDASWTDYEAWDWITIWRLVKPTSIWTDYHIPSYTEWDNLITAWTTLWAWTENDGVGFSTYLKIPTANSRSTSWVIVGSGDTGSYRTTTSNSQYRYILSVSHRQADAGVRLALTYPWYAESVRCFKNTPEVPDSWWTTLYDGSSIATGAWIFYDTTNWLISISADGTTWYTIMDKNVWATTVYNYWDTLSQANCGKFYQRWNYYGFPWSGTLSDTSSTQVDTTWYSADGELYYDDTFITWNDDWSSPSNTWLRSATWPWFMEATIKENAISAIWYKAWRWIAIWDIAFKNRWPCAVWYHMGTKNEFYDIYSMWINMWAWTSSSGTNVSAYLLMPYTWVRVNTSWARQTSGGNYWTCSWYMSTTTTSNQLTWGSRWFNDSNNAGPSLTSGLPSQYWFPIRPLKDDYVAPDGSWTTMFNGSSYATWAWIFWNQTLWIISITDWTNWYTLADRNLWATAVRHYWDETTDDNCGNLFQWWNNYAFPRSWSVTTSNTVVNVEWYWPDNPYSNSTFRLYSSIMGGRWRWYGEWADNLWWWEEAWPSVVPWDGNYIWNTLPFDPTNTWSTWQLLTKSGSGYEWQTKYTLPTGTATSWYVLTKTASSASSYAWRAAPATWIQKVSASPLDIKYIWAWTQAEYDALDSYSADTLYFTV